MVDDTRAAHAHISDEIHDSLSALLEHLAYSGPIGDPIHAIPPVSLEQQLNGGPNLLIGRYYGTLLTEDLPLPPHAQILDVGCGYGRIALDLANRLSPDQHYVGLDPNADAIAWATSNIASARPNFTFERIDITSKPYNPTGTLRGADFRFPCDDDSLDLVFMISVMTHIDLDNVETYIRESARTLKSTGRLVATFFLLNDEVDELIAAGKSRFELEWPHGESRVENPDDPELAIAHPRDRVLGMLRDAGFAHVQVRGGNWCGRSDAAPMDYQDLVIADRGPVPHATPNERLLDENAQVRDLAERLAVLGMTATEVSSLLPWAAAVSLNALRWRDEGYTLDLGDEAGELDFTHTRHLGLQLPTPDGYAPGEFVALDEAEAVAVVAAAQGSATRQALTGFLAEVLGNARRVRAALHAGATAVLQSSTAPDRTAPIPPHGG